MKSEDNRTMLTHELAAQILKEWEELDQIRDAKAKELDERIGDANTKRWAFIEMHHAHCDVLTALMSKNGTQINEFCDYCSEEGLL